MIMILFIILCICAHTNKVLYQNVFHLLFIQQMIYTSKGLVSPMENKLSL